MSEDIDYSDYYPIKNDWHKNKHTLRYKHTSYGLKSCKNPILECNRVIKKDKKPITELDEFFFNTNTSLGPLNKEILWSNVENLLEDLSNSTSKKWTPYEGVVYKTFHIPVKNYILQDTIRKEMSWLKWNNQHYDPSYLYTFDGSDDDSKGILKKYCLSKWIEPEIDNLESTGKKVFNQKNNKKKLVKTKECYCEIDLGDVSHIQSIVTFGKYPSTRYFPKRKKSSYTRYYCDTSKPHVNVVERVSDDSYVTKYSVSYKDSQTQKWIQYNEFMDGNINSYTSKINAVSILSRYIRIKPIEYVNTKSMIIYVYVSKNKNKTERHDTDNDDEEEELVSYTLLPPTDIHKKIVNDGNSKRSSSPDWYFAQHQKNARKDKVKNIMKEQLDGLKDGITNYFNGR